MPTDSCSKCSLPSLRFRVSLSRQSDSAAERHFNGKPESFQRSPVLAVLPKI